MGDKENKLNLNFQTNLNLEEMADWVSARIDEILLSGKKVAWFLSGGSVIPLEVLISKKIKNHNENNLIVTLADERFGDVGHKDSNWQQLIEADFDFSKKSTEPFINGQNSVETIALLNKSIKKIIDWSDCNIMILGMGTDGHIAGILPKSQAVYSKDLVCYYESDQYIRLTITGEVIEQADEVFLYAFGEAKWPKLKNLEKEINIDLEPVQILKRVKLLTIFSDCK